MKTQENFKMVDLMKYTSAFNLGWRFSRYDKSTRMIEVIKNIHTHNKGDSFCEGLLSGFDAGRSKTVIKGKRMSELDIIFSKKEKENEKDLER